MQVLATQLFAVAWVLLAMVAGAAPSKDTKNPAPFLRGTNAGNVDNQTGDHYYYFHAGGADDCNRRLSQQRADAVTAWLVQRTQLPAEQFRTAAFGESRPVAPNTKPDGSDDPAGRQRNRRVELLIRK